MTKGLTRRRWVAWFLLGSAFAFALQLLQVQAMGGGWDGLLQVSATSPLRPVIEAQLGPVSLVQGAGHDGQISYVIGLDPAASELADLVEFPGYRWRRVLYPGVAGLAGALGGHALLLSLAVWAAVGMGLATAAVVDLGALLGLRSWVALGILGNLGVWFSVQLLTADALAVGLALLGVTLWLRGAAFGSVFAFAAAALAKDQYLLVAWSVAGWVAWQGGRAAAMRLAVGSSLPLAAWTVWLQATVGGAVGAEGNLAPPFVGILGGTQRWRLFGTDEIMLGVLALGALGVAIVAPMAARRPLLRFLAWPWVALALVLSHWVWQTGNNAVRVLLPLWVFGTVAVVAAVGERTTRPVNALRSGTDGDRRSGT